MEQKLCQWLENNPTIQKWALQAGKKWIVSFLKNMATKNPKILDILQVISLLVTLWGALPSYLLQAGIAEPAWLANYETLGTSACAFVLTILLQIPNAKNASSPVIALPSTQTPVSGKQVENQNK